MLSVNREFLIQLLNILDDNCSIQDHNALKSLIYCIYCNKNYLKNNDEEINLILDSIVDKLFIEMEIENKIKQSQTFPVNNHLIANHLKDMISN